jgi:hypothetical protein
MGTQSKQPKPIPDVRLMYQLAERYSEASELLDEQARGTAYGCSAPQLLIDSFAVELYLKCLYVLDHGQAPNNTHDWTELFGTLKPHTQSMIRDTFNDTIRQDPVLSNLKVINPDAPHGLTDFNKSLEVAARTFDHRRYLYETAGTSDWFYADLIRNAIRKVTKLDLRLAAVP